MDSASVSDLFDVLEAYEARVAVERRERHLVDAPDFNAFDFLRDDETGLSRILAWLLDPNGSHGQGDAFLTRFIDHFGIDVGGQPTSRALIRVEAPTALIAQHRRRIDVHVRIGAFTLAIENKPWAGWQSEQVRAYLGQLAAESQAGHCLVLIKGVAGELPLGQLTLTERTKAIAEGTLVDTDYVTLHAWAAALSSTCRAPRICALLDDFAAHVLRTFGDQPVTTAQEELARSLLNDADRRRTALYLVSAGDALLAEVASRGDTHVREALESNWTLGEQRLNPDLRWSGHDIVLDGAAPFHFKVEFDGYRLSEPFYGLWLPREASTRSPYPAVQRDLEASGGRAGKSGSSWIWWRWTDDGIFGLRDRNDEVAVWEAIASGELARMTVAAAKRAEAELRKAGVLPCGSRKRYRVK